MSEEATEGTPRLKRHNSPTRTPSFLIRLSRSKSLRRGARYSKKDPEIELREKLEEFIRVLRKIPQLRALPRSRIVEIIERIGEKRYRRDDVVIKQGHAGNQMYIIKSGAFAVTVASKEGEDPTLVRTLANGSYFGEYALLSNSPRSATVTAVEPGECYIINRSQFEALFPVDAVLRGRAHLESQCILEGSSVLNSMSPLVLQKLRAIMRPVVYSHNEVIAKAGELKTWMWCVVEGNVTAINSRTFRLYKPGELISIEGLDSEVPVHWKANLKVTSPSAVCMYISQEDLRSYLHGRYYSHFQERLRRYMRSLNEPGHSSPSETDEWTKECVEDQIAHAWCLKQIPVVKTMAEASQALHAVLPKFRDFYHALFFLVHKNPVFVGLFHRVMWMTEKRAVRQIGHYVKRALKRLPHERSLSDLRLVEILFLATPLASGIKHEGGSLDDLYKHLVYRRLEGGHFLYKSGDPINDGNAYLILSGSIDEIGDSNQVVRHFNPGSIFGTLALSTSAQRHFSAVASSTGKAAVEMISINRTSYMACRNNRAHYQNRVAEISYFKDFLRSSSDPFDQYCSEHELFQICSTIVSHVFPAHHVFFQNDSRAHALYIIEEGTVGINRNLPHEHSLISEYCSHVSEIGKGGFFGVSCFKDSTLGAPLFYEKEEDNFVAKTIVRALVIPEFMVNNFSGHLMDAFKSVVFAQRRFRANAASEAAMCRRLDVITTMSQTSALKSIVTEILDGIENNYHRPSSKTILRSTARDHLREQAEMNIPSAYEEMLKLRALNAMAVVHSRVREGGDPTLVGSFQKVSPRAPEPASKEMTPNPNALRPIPPGTKRGPTKERRQLPGRKLHPPAKSASIPTPQVTKTTDDVAVGAEPGPEIEVATRMWKVQWKSGGKPRRQKPSAMRTELPKTENRIRNKRKKYEGYFNW